MTADLFGSPPTQIATRRRAHLTFRGNVQHGRHGWLRLTPAYSLHVVRDLLAGRHGDQVVLDPFSGTGTTALAAAALGMAAHAVDINPFLVWLGNAKLRRYSARAADDLRAVAAEMTRRHSGHPSRARPWVPAIHQVERWWDADALAALSALWAGIRAREAEDELSDLMKIAFCRAAIETSHAAFNHQSMSFRPASARTQPTLFTTRTEGQERVMASFMAAAEDLAHSLSVDVPIAEARVWLGDARHLERILPAAYYTVVITSPPYPNRMSYIRELRPYMYWLGYLTSGRQAGELDWSAIGGTWGCATSRLAAWRPNEALTIPYPGFDPMIARIQDVHPLLGRYVHKYFEDIKEHLASLRRVVALGATCHYIVGNSKFYDTLVPTEEIYAALLEDAGFAEVRIERLRKRNSKKELYEFVVHARAAGSP